VGASEGGVVTALSVERYPKDYAGGLSLCGPIGDFRSQIDYWEDFRVLFDVFYPGTLPESAISIPDEVINNWDVPVTGYKDQIAYRLSTTDPLITAQFLATARAPYDPAVPATAVLTTQDILWYNVFATNDGQEQLKGNPYGNLDRNYPGAVYGAAVNDKVARFAADQSAIAHLRRYNTTGELNVPLVTMHTTGDPVVPYWHEALYADKVPLESKPMLAQIEVTRYGHCAFYPEEIAAAFSTLVTMVNAQPAP
jgi:hypothetical protein